MMGSIDRKTGPQDGYHVELDMGTDGKVEFDILRAHDSKNGPGHELLITHSGIDTDGKAVSIVLALDWDHLRIYRELFVDAVASIEVERQSPSEAPAKPGPKKKGGTK